MIVLALAEEWVEPRTLITLISVIIGLAGLLFGVLSHRWVRRESRLDALSSILQPLARSAQSLLKANGNRRKCEQLKHSYPNLTAAPDVGQWVTTLVKEYGECMEVSEASFRDAEAKFAACHFRFPNVGGHWAHRVRARALASRMRCSSFMKWSSSDYSSGVKPPVFSLWISSAT